MCHCILADASNYGPFGPIVGYTFAIVSTVGMIGFLARGPLKNWEVPEEGFTKILSRSLGFLGAAFVIGGWFVATPDTMGWLLFAAIIVLVLATAGTIFYALTIAKYKFIREVANPDHETVRPVICLGGDALTEGAIELKKQKSFTEQQLFEAAAFDADSVWPREARIRVLLRLAIAYVLALALGAGGISWLGYVVQVRLSGKPAADIIYQKDAPGIEQTKLPTTPETK